MPNKKKSPTRSHKSAKKSKQAGRTRAKSRIAKPSAHVVERDRPVEAEMENE